MSPDLPVACPWCNNHHNFIKNGHYWRYAFTGNEKFAIQRYLCKHDQCRRSFSILPQPYLRITRYCLCTLTQIVKLVEQKAKVSQIRDYLNTTWTVAKRIIKKAREISGWIRTEAKTEPIWSPTPCMHPQRCWSNFIRDFAAKFYPKRYGKIGPTQNVYRKVSIG